MNKLDFLKKAFIRGVNEALGDDFSDDIEFIDISSTEISGHLHSDFEPESLTGHEAEKISLAVDKLASALPSIREPDSVIFNLENKVSIEVSVDEDNCSLYLEGWVHLKEDEDDEVTALKKGMDVGSKLDKLSIKVLEKARKL